MHTMVLNQVWIIYGGAKGSQNGVKKFLISYLNSQFSCPFEFAIDLRSDLSNSKTTKGMPEKNKLWAIIIQMRHQKRFVPIVGWLAKPNTATV